MDGAAQHSPQPGFLSRIGHRESLEDLRVMRSNRNSLNMVRRGGLS